MRCIQITATGGPQVLDLVEGADPSPGPGEIAVGVAAAGVNFIDTYHRSGLYQIAVPGGLGLEGAGEVVAVGEGAEAEIGDRVAWCTALGSYAEQVVMSAGAAVSVPPSIDLETAAASMLQGITAHYLATTSFPLLEGSKCLVHAGAGGVGLLLIQIAKARGAEVFTTVGTTEKAELARAAGADHTILYRDVDFAEAISELAGERPLDVVYDGVGQTVFDASLGLLKPRGMLVTYGNASGPVPPVEPLTLAQHGSLFLHRPRMVDFIADPAEYQQRATELFGWIDSGALDVRIGHRYPLAEAEQAHRDLEGRKTTGKVLLIP